MVISWEGESLGKRREGCMGKNTHVRKKRALFLFSDVESFPLTHSKHKVKIACSKLIYLILLVFIYCIFANIILHIHYLHMFITYLI